MSKEFLQTQLKEKLLISLGHSKALKLCALFLVRKNLARKSFCALLISNLLYKLLLLLTPCKAIDLIEMIFWVYNFLMRLRTIKITTIFLFRAAALLVLHHIKDLTPSISQKVEEIMAIYQTHLLVMILLVNLSFQIMESKWVHLCLQQISRKNLNINNSPLKISNQIPSISLIFLITLNSPTTSTHKVYHLKSTESDLILFVKSQKMKSKILSIQKLKKIDFFQKVSRKTDKSQNNLIRINSE